MVTKELRKFILNASHIEIDNKKSNALLEYLETNFPSYDIEKMFEGNEAIPYDIELAIKNYITVNETFFFRHPEHFDLIREELNNKNTPITVFFGGCSTGQEVYSLAMLLNSLNVKYNFIAIDISHAALEGAKKGIYSESDITRTPEAYKHLCEKYLDQEFNTREVRYEIKEYLKANIFFSPGDIFKTPTVNNDIIFCRNILIYFTEEDRQILINKLYHGLYKSGLLIIGAAEIITGEIAKKFEKIQPGVYRKAYDR